MAGSQQLQRCEDATQGKKLKPRDVFILPILPILPSCFHLQLEKLQEAGWEDWEDNGDGFWKVCSSPQGP